MFIVYNLDEMRAIITDVFDAAPGKPVLIDKFLEDAYELDVDCILTKRQPLLEVCSAR